MGKPLEAELECSKALAIEQKLVDDNPAHAVFRDRLATDLISLGDVVRYLGRVAEAKGVYERAIALRKPGIHEDSTDMWHRFELACMMRRRGLSLRDLGDSTGAATDVRQALTLCLGLPARSGYEFETACCHAALSGLAGRAGSGVSPAEGNDEAARAMDWLHQAAAMGYRNANELRIESAFDSLRSRRDFQLLMMDMAFPADPFAQVR
jgi:hypothetical protein